MIWKAMLLALMGIVLVGVRPAAAGPDEEHYYMLIFGQQDEANAIKNSHTFAVFVKSTNGDKADGRFESHTISWMPRTMEIDPVKRTPEPGVNLSLAESLNQAKSVKSKVALWGPYRVKKELYEMAVAQEKRLNAGTREYILLDPQFRGKTASNCIHAVSDLDTTQTPLETGTACGNTASELVANYFQPYVIPSQESMEWLLKRLKIDPKSIRFATLGTARVTK